jgi:hypothetical protein
MRERTGIDDDEIDAVGFCLLHSIDQLMLRVALAAGDVMAQVGSDPPAARFDVGKRRRAIDIGLTRTKKVQVRPVNKEKCRHLPPIPASSRRRGVPLRHGSLRSALLPSRNTPAGVRWRDRVALIGHAGDPGVYRPK